MTRPSGKVGSAVPPKAARVSSPDAPEPPPDIHVRKLEVKEVPPSQLIRISRVAPGVEPLNFRASGGNRFDAPDKSYETLYVAETLDVCFAETLLRGDEKSHPLDSGRTHLPEAELRVRGVFQLTGNDNLRLAVFRGAALKRLGGDASISSIVPYAIPQDWSKSIHSHPDGVDGFIYTSRHLNDKEAVVLFGRAATRLNLNARQTHKLIEHPDFGKLLDLFELAI